MASDIVSETFTGNEKPEGFDPAIRDRYAEAESQYYRITPVGGANKEEIRQVISAPEETVRAKIKTLPRQDTEDAATLYAYYGNFGIAEPVRIAMEALCAELVRATYAVSDDKKRLSEERIKHLARSHDLYLDLLREQALGRKAWFDECRAHGETLR